MILLPIFLSNLERFWVEASFFEEGVYEVCIALNAYMPLIHFGDRAVVFLVVVDRDHAGALFVRRFESPFNTDLLVRRSPFTLLDPVMWLAELIHKLWI